jgi:hypothetical protein
MPTQKRLEGSVSGSEIKDGRQSDMSAREALAIGETNSSGMPTHLESDMTQAEALAVAWTGIEALAIMQRANIYRSPRTNRVIVELLAVELDPANGLIPATHYDICQQKQ